MDADAVMGTEDWFMQHMQHAQKPGAAPLPNSPVSGQPLLSKLLIPNLAVSASVGKNALLFTSIFASFPTLLLEARWQLRRRDPY